MTSAADPHLVSEENKSHRPLVWTPEEDEAIKRYGCTLPEKSQKQIHRRRQVLGIKVTQPRPWTQAELDMLAEGKPVPGRSAGACRSARHMLMMTDPEKKGRLFSDWEVLFIKKNFGKMTTQEIGDRLSRSAQSVQSKLTKLGMKHTPDGYRAFYKKFHRYRGKPKVVVRRQLRTTPERAHRYAAAAVPAGTAKWLADIAVATVVADLLSGYIRVRCVPEAMKKAIRAEFRLVETASRFGPRSLDATVFDDGNTKLVDTISVGMWG